MVFTKYHDFLWPKILILGPTVFEIPQPKCHYYSSLNIDNLSSLTKGHANHRRRFQATMPRTLSDGRQ
jgi:hypothetical protein